MNKALATTPHKSNKGGIFQTENSLYLQAVSYG